MGSGVESCDCVKILSFGQNMWFDDALVISTTLS